MMKLFKKRTKINNKGLSLVELVCAVAIFAIVITAVGSVMVVSAQNYSKGSYEIDVQQEAQTTTNLIGNLIVDADTACYDGTLAIPLLKINESNDVEYQISYDKDNGILKYKEIDKTTTPYTEAEGVLAENVVAFNTNLSKEATSLEQDRNVEVSITIEKGGRTYNASYSMTARNGSSDSVVTDEAVILVEKEIVLEPGQTYKLPVTVLGTIANKSFTVAKGDSSDDVTLSYGKDYVQITVGIEEKATIPLVISTVAKKDDGFTPVKTESVNINIRRVDNMTYTKQVTGVEGKKGSSYVINFGYSVSNPDKVYGKDFDTDYVNPKQFSFSYSITGADAGDTWKTYIDESTLVETAVDSPSVSFSFFSGDAAKSLPKGAKIAITCTALHTTGTNKSGNPYSPIASRTVYIEQANISMSSELNRGNDNVDVLVEHDYLQSLIDKYGDEVTKTIKIYEAVYDAASDTWLKYDYNGDGVIDDGDVVLTYSEENDETNTKLRPAVSAQMHPFKDYIVQYSLSIKYVDPADGYTKIWPNSVPEDYANPSNYMMEYPLTAVHVTYSEGATEDTAKEYAWTGPVYGINIRVDGFDMDYGPYKDHVGWIVEKKNESGVYEPASVSLSDFVISTGYDDGTAVFQAKFEQPGYYRLKTVLKNFEYIGYDGSVTIMNDPLYQLDVPGQEDYGVMYFKVAVTD